MTERETLIEALWIYELDMEKILNRSLLTRRENTNGGHPCGPQCIPDGNLKGEEILQPQLSDSALAAEHYNDDAEPLGEYCSGNGYLIKPRQGWWHNSTFRDCRGFPGMAVSGAYAEACEMVSNAGRELMRGFERLAPNPPFYISPLC